MKKNEYLKDVVYDVVSSVLQGIGVYCFIANCNIAPGGATGVAILGNYITGMPIGLLTFLVNVPLFIMSYMYLGKVRTFKTLKTVLIGSVILDLVIAPIFPQYVGDRLMSSAFGGILCGIGMAMVFMRGSTTGGTDIVAKLLQRKYPHMQIGFALMLIDLVIIAASAVVFNNIEAVLYGLLSLICMTKTIDAFLYGINRGAMVTIVSPRNEEIAEEIMRQLDRGATFLQSRGAYSKKSYETLFCVIENKQFYLVKEIIDSIDDKAFVIVSETKEVDGEGFLAERVE